MNDLFKPLYDVVKANLEACTDREVRRHFLAAKKWFEWKEDDTEGFRTPMIEAILGADPIAVEGGALDFYVHRKLMPKGRLEEWRNAGDWT